MHLSFPSMVTRVLWWVSVATAQTVLPPPQFPSFGFPTEEYQPEVRGFIPDLTGYGEDQYAYGQPPVNFNRLYTTYPGPTLRNIFYPPNEEEIIPIQLGSSPNDTKNNTWPTLLDSWTQTFNSFNDAGNPLKPTQTLSPPLRQGFPNVLQKGSNSKISTSDIRPDTDPRISVSASYPLFPDAGSIPNPIFPFSEPNVPSWSPPNSFFNYAPSFSTPLQDSQGSFIRPDPRPVIADTPNIAREDGDGSKPTSDLFNRPDLFQSRSYPSYYNPRLNLNTPFHRLGKPLQDFERRSYFNPDLTPVRHGTEAVLEENKKINFPGSVTNDALYITDSIGYPRTGIRDKLTLAAGRRPNANIPTQFLSNNCNPSDTGDLENSNNFNSGELSPNPTYSDQVGSFPPDSTTPNLPDTFLSGSPRYIPSPHSGHKPLGQQEMRQIPHPNVSYDQPGHSPTP